MPTIKLALTGDDHVNLPKRSEEARRIFDWMIEDWRARGVHLIGISGDFVDGPMTERDRAWVIDRAAKCAEIAPTIFVDGNHEIELALRNALRGRSGKFPIIVEDGADVHVVETTAGPVAVACVSFPHKARLLAAVGRPVSPDEVDEITGQALNDIFRGLGVQVRELGLPTVGLVHGTIRGSKVGADDQPDRPLGLDIGTEQLAQIGAHFYCVAHIHKAQHWTYNDVVIATPSSPFYADFGEAHHDKGYILAEFHALKGIGLLINDDKLTSLDMSKGKMVVKWERIKTPAVPMLLIENEWGMVVDDVDEGHEFGWKKDLRELVGGWQQVAGADIRLRYKFASDQRKAVNRAAEEAKETLLGYGAVNVTLDPQQIPTTRARIPGLAKAATLEEKVLLYWESIDFKPTRARTKELLETLDSLREQAAALGLSMGTSGRATPTIQRIRTKGWFKLPGENEIDFEKLEGPLTAIVAPNETGKTILIQLMGRAVLYGETANRGTLNDLAIAKDTFIESTFQMGEAQYVLTQNCNGPSRSGSVSLLKNGVAELDKAGRDEFKTGWAAKNLLPKNVHDAVICQSGTTSIIDLNDAPRVDLLLKVLGLEIYEALAEMARKRAAAVSEKVATVTIRIDEIGDLKLPELGQAVTTAQSALETETTTLTAAEDELQKARASAEAIKVKQAEYEQLIARRLEVDERQAGIVAKLTELETKLALNLDLVGKKEEIESATAKQTLLEQEQASFLHACQKLEVEHGRALGTLQGAKNELVSMVGTRDIISEQITGIASRIENIDITLAVNQEVLTKGDLIRSAVTADPEKRKAYAEKRELLASQDTRAAELKGQLSEIRARWNGNAQKTSELARKEMSLEATVATKTSVQAAANDVKEIESDVATVEAEVVRWRQEVNFLQDKLTTSKDTRISSLYVAHEEIHFGVEDPKARSGEAMKAEDSLSVEESQTPDALATAKQEVANCEAALVEFRKALKTLQPVANALQEVLAAEESLLAVSAELEALGTLHESLTLQSNEIIAEQDELEKETAQTTLDLKSLQSEIDDLQELLAQAHLLTTAEAHIASLQEQRKALEADKKDGEAALLAAARKVDEHSAVTTKLEQQIEVSADEIAKNEGKKLEYLEKIIALRATTSLTPLLANAESNITELDKQKRELQAENAMLVEWKIKIAPSFADPPKPIDQILMLLEAKVGQGRQIVTNLTVNLATAEKALTAAQQKDARRANLTVELRGHQEDVSNLTVIAQSLGSEGLQREEVSVAGPELTNLANDLLRSAGDTRHTVSIETEKLHSNKKRMIPTLDINVFDSEEGITKESRRLSDAGKVLVGEPFGLALVLLACQRAGLKSPTILRDEVSGVMDPVNAPRYIAMLRRFANILNARVIFIAQQPDIQALADSRITISDGKITVS